MPYYPPASGGGGSTAENVVSCFPGEGVVQGATFTVDAGGVLAVTQFDDGQNNDTWHFSYRVPSSANGLSISQVQIHYILIGTTDRNLLLLNSVYRYPVANDSALTTDSDGGVLYATGTGTSTNHKFINVSSTAYNGIGAVGTGDLIMMQINRQGADATDTYGQAFTVLRVDFTFA